MLCCAAAAAARFDRWMHGRGRTADGGKLQASSIVVHWPQPAAAAASSSSSSLVALMMDRAGPRPAHSHQSLPADKIKAIDLLAAGRVCRAGPLVCTYCAQWAFIVQWACLPGR